MVEFEMTGAGCARNLRNLYNLLVVTAALGMLIFAATVSAQPTGQPTLHAATQDKQSKNDKPPPKRRVIPVTIAKGETYTISGLEKGANTKSKAGRNPNALSIQPQSSGDIVLLGTEGGSWKIDATLATGEKVTYDVKVKAEAPPINSLAPGTAPPAMSP
jgi:hypothetical protein